MLIFKMKWHKQMNDLSKTLVERDALRMAVFKLTINVKSVYFQKSSNIDHLPVVKTKLNIIWIFTIQ